MTKAWIWGKSEAVKRYFSLAEKNTLLEEENAILYDRLRKYEQRNDTLLWNGNSNSPDEHFIYTKARIIKLSTNSQKNYFIIDKGEKDGIKEKSGVVTPYGIVGIIEATTESLSYGRTIMNPQTGISARLGRHGISGSLNWDGIHKDGAILHGIPLHYEVQKQDTVWTSGYSSIFPSGIALGVVSGSKIRNGSEKDISVTLFQNMGSLDYVYVASNIYAEQISALDNSNDE